jgi:hypothetical protein
MKSAPTSVARWCALGAVPVKGGSRRWTVLPSHGLAPRVRSEERAILELRKCMPQLLLGVHRDRTVPGHRLLQRLAEMSTNRIPSSVGLDLDLVPTVEENEGAVVGLGRRLRVRPSIRLVGMSWSRLRAAPLRSSKPR